MLLPLTALLSMSSIFVSAQSYDTDDRLYFKERRYHKITGWVSSTGVHVGNLAAFANNLSSVDENPSFVFEYLMYKHISPKIGLGGGLAYKLVPTRNLGLEDFNYYQFAEIYSYGKIYLNDNRRRFFVDSKFGYALAQGKVEYWCLGCSQSTSISLRYTSGAMIQPGVGFDFANANKVKWGIKLSSFHNYTSEEQDRHEPEWNGTPNELIVSKYRNGFLSGLLLGVSIYL